MRINIIITSKMCNNIYYHKIIKKNFKVSERFKEKFVLTRYQIQ